MSFTEQRREKLSSLKKLVISHPQFEQAYLAIVNAYDMKTKVGVAENILCVGQSGTGKSTLKQLIKRNYPVRETEEKSIIPVLVVDTPSVPTVKNFAEEMLIQLGDPLFHKGSAIDKTNRILNFIDQCEVKMVIVDELQHFIDQGKKRTPDQVSDWLKTVIDKAGVSTVLMGLDRCEHLLQVNEQLRRRFSRRINILPFDISQNDSLKNFIAVIGILDEKVGLPRRINLKDRMLIESIFFATNGIIDYLVKLFIGGYEQAIKNGQDELTAECFQSAFNENIWVEGVGALNPFHKKFGGEKLDKPGMPFHRFAGAANIKASR